jgi:hypothetical protein
MHDLDFSRRFRKAMETGVYEPPDLRESDEELLERARAAGPEEYAKTKALVAKAQGLSFEDLLGQA